MQTLLMPLNYTGGTQKEFGQTPCGSSDLILKIRSLGVLSHHLKFREEKSMVMKFHGNVRGEVRVNFLALLASKPRSFMCGALRLSGIVRANVRLNIAIPMPFCP